jgi:hypothetical protein
LEQPAQRGVARGIRVFRVGPGVHRGGRNG